MLNKIIKKIESMERISDQDALFLYKNAPLSWLQKYAHRQKQKFHQDKVFYNRNIHFEPTNYCVYSCKFCSFYRKSKATKEEGAWDYSFEDLKEKLSKYKSNTLTEIHITGGVYPTRGIDWAINLLSSIKKFRPSIHIKAFTAVEIIWFCKISKISLKEGLKLLQKAGLDSLPGGGAEIFDKEIRRKIAGGKAPANRWIEVHRLAHKLGLKSNATMLYGHIENYWHRVDHMSKLRSLQDETGGFNAFIPLRYRNKNNHLSYLAEVDKQEDFRNYAISRLYFDNIKHLKAYWVMLGIDVALDSLEYGVDDIDGTIDDSTKIYSMAGSITKPVLNSKQLCDMIIKYNGQPIERDSLYNIIEVL